MAAAPVNTAQSRGKRLSRSTGFELFARSGLLARGVVYAIVGVLAIKVALGDGGKATDQQGALQIIAKQPSGTILLIAMAVGLVGYASWRLMSAWLGSDDDLKDRVSAAVSGIAYLILAITAVKILIGSGAGSNNPDKQTGGVLGWPGGRYIIGVIGAVIVIEGLAQLRKGVTRSFLEKSRTGGMSESVKKAFTTLGGVGYCARAVVFGLIGYFLIRAAIDFNPDEAVALDGALAKVAHASYGPYLLGVVAAGLIAFAAYCIADAYYRVV